MKLSITHLIIIFILHHNHFSLGAEEEEEDDGSYSFHKFRGPVSGEIHQVVVPGRYHQPPSLDYIAKPDYGYSYGVQDPKTDNSQTHKETRNGDAVRGEYRVLQPDGMLRIVRYTADGENGFQATVTYEKA